VIDNVTVTFSVSKARWLALLLKAHPNMKRERESLERMVRWRESQVPLLENLYE
jgi:hypothetical protein